MRWVFQERGEGIVVLGLGTGASKVCKMIEFGISKGSANNEQRWIRWRSLDLDADGGDCIGYLGILREVKSERQWDYSGIRNILSAAFGSMLVSGIYRPLGRHKRPRFPGTSARWKSAIPWPMVSTPLQEVIFNSSTHIEQSCRPEQRWYLCEIIVAYLNQGIKVLAPCCDCLVIWVR